MPIQYFSKKRPRNGGSGTLRAESITGLTGVALRVAMRMQPAERVKVKQPKIPSMGTHGKSRFDADTVTAALIMRELGIRREVIAAAIGCSPYSICNWESGHNRGMVTR